MTLRLYVRVKSSRRGGNQCVLWTQEDTSVVYITFYASTEVVVSKTRGRGRVLVHPARAGRAPRRVRRHLRHPSRGCKTSRLTCTNSLVCLLPAGVPLVFRRHSHITRAAPLLHTFLLLLVREGFPFGGRRIWAHSIS